MNPSNEVVRRANEAVANMELQPHRAGDTVRIYVPVPHGSDIADSQDAIDLDNVSVSPVRDGKARDTDGRVLFDAGKMGADLFLVEGTMKR